MKRIVSAFIVLAVVLSGCGGVGYPDDGIHELSGLKFRFVDEGNCELTKNALQGTCKIAFTRPRIRNQNNYNIHFVVEPDGELTFHAHADQNANGGMSYRVAFSDQGKWSGEVLADSERFDITSSFSQLRPFVRQAFSIDVHRHLGSDSHYIAWNERGELNKGEFNADLSGWYWGLTLKDATVIYVSLDEAREEG